MIPELGQLLLWLALALALLQSVCSLWGAQVNDARLMALSRPLILLQFCLLSASFGCLIAIFVGNDFSVQYASAHSNSLLPVWYRVSAVWGGHEGSMLLWVLILSLWSAAVAMGSKALPAVTVSRVLAIMSLILIGFLAFILFTSNPFDRLLPFFPNDGQDLNPLLQDIGLILHPPMLYMGYVGFSVAFAFAIAGLLGREIDTAWARWARPWTNLAWCFLTIGIALGSWWAYYELGWGGWWFWDPVENASFMPWLIGTALIHSLAATEKRGVFKSWTVLLAITAFSLSLLGTFLVRSGVLTSVHAFASDPDRGLFVLVFLGVVVGLSLLLFVLRASELRSYATFNWASREVFIWLNNLILAVATFGVLLGTLSPLIADSLDMGKMSIGKPWFNAFFSPLTLLLLALMAFGSFIRWKQAQPDWLKQGLIGLVPAIVAGGSLYALEIEQSVWQSLALGLAVWVWLCLVQGVWRMVAQRQSRWVGLTKLSRSFWGMWIAHSGILVTVIGVAFTSYQSVERDLRLAPGGSVEVGGYQFRFKQLIERAGPNYQATQGQFEVWSKDRQIALLKPEKRQYRVQQNVMTEAGIDAGLFRDLYVSLGEPLDNGAWAIRIYYKPFVRWIWLGAILMALGGGLALLDPRYRRSKTAAIKEALK